MIEVLVTLVVLSIGLLGVMGMQTRLQVTEMESYQRSQALVLLDDMASRLASNRADAASYVTGAGSPLGVGNSCTYDDDDTRQVQDSCEWSNSLQGASEKVGTANVGAFIGGRGCVEDLGNDEYLVTVAWQGVGPVSAPPASVACGNGLYDDGKKCTNDRCRRALTTIVRFSKLL